MRQKDFYFSNMVRLVSSISVNHTFKVSKSIRGFRLQDSKFINENMKLFIVLNEEGLVVNWKLKEIEPELQSVKSMSGASLKYIFTDTSCGCREIYEDIFPDALIKLDLFHACQRITKLLTWPKDFRKIWYFVKITTCKKLGTLRKPTPKRKDF